MSRRFPTTLAELGLATHAMLQAQVNRTFFMGFNEPNNLHNCNQEPRQVAQEWKEIMALWPNSQLVSPATAGNGVPWFDQFFGNCSEL